MITAAKVLDRVTGYLFFTGFVTSRLKIIPVSLVGAIFNLISLFSYLSGYLAWYLAAFLYPDHPRKQDEWYGFAEFKIQYQLAALIGLIATIMCLIMPVLIIPVAWIYTISNTIWAISEYHKLKHPPPSTENYSTAKQSVYVRYAAAIAINSAITAVSASIVFFFPPLAIPLITAATIVGLALTAIAIYYWGKHTFGKFTPDNGRIGHSYTVVDQSLAPEPQHGLGLELGDTNSASPPNVRPSTSPDISNGVTANPSIPAICARNDATNEETEGLLPAFSR